MRAESTSKRIAATTKTKQHEEMNESKNNNSDNQCTAHTFE